LTKASSADGTRKPETRFVMGRGKYLSDQQKRGGRPLERRDAKGMIEDRAGEKKARRATPTADEARMRLRAIGGRLRQMFEDVVSEPVPEEFLEILRQADERATKTEPEGE
jgi:hypothetical protein